MLVVGSAWLAGPVLGEPAASPPDPLSAPSEYGIRFTPAMARGLAREFVRDELVRGYELDPAREQEAIETVSRRMMEALHSVDTDANQVVAERLVTTFLQAIQEGKRVGHRPLFSPDLATAFGRDMQPFLPAVRTLVRDVAQDVRPMLSMKQQLRFAGELMAVHAALDGFETAMQRWVRGGAAPGEDPFRPDRQPKLGPDGASDELRSARKKAGADNRVDSLCSEWDEYVKDAGRFYGFDEAQSATASSVLREIKQRAEALGQNDGLNARRHRYVFWDTLWRSLGPEFRGPNHPVHHLLTQAARSLQDALGVLDEELKQRIDRIPRDPQRRRAEEEMHTKLAKFGLHPQYIPEGGSNHDN